MRKSAFEKYWENQRFKYVMFGKTEQQKQDMKAMARAAFEAGRRAAKKGAK